jgi:hypothetical protein
VEPIRDSARENAGDTDPALAASVPPARPRHNLPPKGSCWYCEKPLDNVRRFCGKECADGFDDEAAFSGQNMPA